MQVEKRDERRRSFIKGVVAGSALLAGLFSARGKAEAAQQAKDGADASQEVLYRETEEFRKYYEMLRS